MWLTTMIIKIINMILTLCCFNWSKRCVKSLVVERASYVREHTYMFPEGHSEPLQDIQLAARGRQLIHTCTYQCALRCITESDGQVADPAWCRWAAKANPGCHHWWGKTANNGLICSLVSVTLYTYTLDFEKYIFCTSVTGSYKNNAC